MSGSEHLDLHSLLAVARKLDDYAETLRVRAATVGSSPQGMGWHSSGARAFARSVEEISSGILVVAAHLQRGADELRALGAAAVARAGGR